METPARHTKTVPMMSVPQIVPSHVCLRCDVCCRFPERDSFLRPYFTALEIQQAVSRGIDPRHFSYAHGCQVDVVPNPSGDGYLCPAFDPETFHCRIYEVRPLDCQLYPFVVMWDQEQQTVLLGWDAKCPFLIDQNVTDAKSQSELPKGSRTDRRQTDMLRFAKRMAERVESEDMIETLANHPKLVTRFQDDVVVIQHLPRVTRRLAPRVE